MDKQLVLPKKIRKLISWIKDIIKSKQRVQKLHLLKNSFEINNGSSRINVKWCEIEKIVAFKKDLLTYDQICLEIYSNKKQFYCSEDFDGWNDFVKELNNQLPRLDKNWIRKVSQPPFEKSRTTIFSKEKFNCSICGEYHEEWPALTFNSPTSYHELTNDEKSTIATFDPDFCTIKYADQTDRFIRVVLKQKIINSELVLDYGLWVSLSEKSWNDYKSNYKNRNHEVQYFGWLNSSIPEYKNTMNIPTTVFTNKGNERPEIIVHEDYTHKFVVDYYNGISKEEAEKRIHEMMKNKV